MRMHPEDVIEIVCSVFGILPSELRSNARIEPIPFVRGCCVKYIRELASCSYPECAKHIGAAGHTTCIAAQRRWRKAIETCETVLVRRPYGMPARVLAKAVDKEVWDRLCHNTADASDDWGYNELLVSIERDEDSAIIVRDHTRPGCHTNGDTIDAAMADLKHAQAFWDEVAKRRGWTAGRVA